VLGLQRAPRCCAAVRRRRRRCRPPVPACAGLGCARPGLRGGWPLPKRATIISARACVRRRAPCRARAPRRVAPVPGYAAGAALCLLVLQVAGRARPGGNVPAGQVLKVHRVHPACERRRAPGLKGGAGVAETALRPARAACTRLAIPTAVCPRTCFAGLGGRLALAARRLLASAGRRRCSLPMPADCRVCSGVRRQRLAERRALSVCFCTLTDAPARGMFGRPPPTARARTGGSPLRTSVARAIPSLSDRPVKCRSGGR
jgi:hypothetical protein